MEYYINQQKVVFYYSMELAVGTGEDLQNLDPFEQLEKEVKYVKRMYERGIGAKEYYPFTEAVD
ncbi:hypothetical protein [Bacillus sp. AK031]